MNVQGYDSGDDGRNCYNKWLKFIGRSDAYVDSTGIDVSNSFDSFTIVVSREDIESKNLNAIFMVLSKLCENRDIAEKNRNKVELSFSGYDNDSRELFEIEEVREWVKSSIDIGFPWFYILNLSNLTVGMKILFYCYSCSKKNQLTDSKGVVEFDNVKGSEFLAKNYENLNKFCEYMRFDKSICSEITDNVNNWVKKNTVFSN